MIQNWIQSDNERKKHKCQKQLGLRLKLKKLTKEISLFQIILQNWPIFNDWKIYYNKCFTIGYLRDKKYIQLNSNHIDLDIGYWPFQPPHIGKGPQKSLSVGS